MKLPVMLFACLVVLLGLSAAPAAQTDPPVLRIVIVKPLQGADVYVQEVERGKRILKRLGVEAEIGVWQATYAGPETGTVIATLKFANKAAFTRSEAAFAKASGDPEYDAWVKRLDEVRVVTSDSLYIERDSPSPVPK